MAPEKKPSGSMGWLDFAFGVASQAAKKLHAEFEAGKSGKPSPAEANRRTSPAPAQRPAGPAWWEILQVSRGASLRQVTAAYRELMSKNHPDKVAHLSERIRRVADEETRRINAAYEAAQRALGDGKGR
ncbi:MAG: J domain-containing protein [Chthoniobacter sp.]|uniref:J domain-containing protein n=1 Tax=Chthoniobacter sp. TaxID=2510640 RepID=UPI0032AA9069